MRTVTWKSVLTGAFGKGGLSLPTGAALVAALAWVQERARFAIEYYRWPSLLTVEYRYFRDVWVAGVYASGAEVYHNGSYWRASEAVTADDIPGEYGSNGVLLAGEGIGLAYSEDGDYIVYTGLGDVESKWVELVRFRKIVQFEQPGKGKIGAFLGAWTVDPLKTTCAPKVDFLLIGDGAVFPPGYIYDGVWIAWRAPAESETPVEWVNTDVYAPAAVVYWTANLYRVLSTTTAGDTPASASAKFELIEFPAWLAPAVKEGTYADILTADGQTAKAGTWHAKFLDQLDEQVSQLTKLQGQTTSLI
jgi:hypothetical protein